MGDDGDGRRLTRTEEGPQRALYGVVTGDGLYLGVVSGGRGGAKGWGLQGGVAGVIVNGGLATTGVLAASLTHKPK